MSPVCIKKCPSVALAQIYTGGNLPTCLLRNPLNCSDETDGATLMLLIDCKHWHLERRLWEMGLILGDKERCWILRGKHVRTHIPTGTACFCLVLPCGDLHGEVKEPQPLNVRNQGDGAQHSVSPPAWMGCRAQTVVRTKAQDASGSLTVWENEWVFVEVKPVQHPSFFRSRELESC